MLGVSLAGDLTLRQQLAVLRLPPAARKKHHRYVAQQVIRKAKRNVQRQTDVHGRALVKRKRGKGKVLRKLPKRLKAYTGPSKAMVTWPKTRTGQIARAHQNGIATTMTAGQAIKAARRRGEPDYSAPATAAQAKALLAAGYRKPIGGTFKNGAKAGQRRTRRVSAKHIMDTMTVGQAGLILRLLRNKASKQQWLIPLPEREFFGLAPADVVDVRNHLIHQILNDVQRAA